jgi:hypothetical protein
MMKYILLSFCFLSIGLVTAQQNKDSLSVINTMEEIFTVCNSSMPESADPKDIIFERLAPYILYTGQDAKRKNKTSCDYNIAEDRSIVNKFGHEIKNWLEHISNYKLQKLEKVQADNTERFNVSLSYSPAASNYIKNFRLVKIKDTFLLEKFE